MANNNAGENGKETRFRTGKEQAKTAKKGGKASGVARRKYASIRDCMADNLDDDKRAELFNVLYNRALHGNLKALDMIMKMEGSKPKEDKQEQSLRLEKLKLEIEEQRLHVEALKRDLGDPDDTETEDSFLKALEGSAASDWAEDIADEETATEDQVQI